MRRSLYHKLVRETYLVNKSICADVVVMGELRKREALLLGRGCFGRHCDENYCLLSVMRAWICCKAVVESTKALCAFVLKEWLYSNAREDRVREIVNDGSSRRRESYLNGRPLNGYYCP